MFINMTIIWESAQYDL